MKIGVSSYSFAKYMKSTGCDYVKICDIAKEMGFDAIEFTDLDPAIMGVTTVEECAKLIREHCDSIGLPIVSYTVGADFIGRDAEAEVERLCRCVDVAVILGAPTMRHDVCYALPKRHLYDWRAAVADMTPYIRRVTEYAKTRGVKTCTENHGFIFQSPERVEALIQSVASENYGWLCDVGNFMCADEDVIRAVSIAAPYAFHAHVKDFLLKTRAEGGCPKGFFETRGGNFLRGTIVGHGVVPVANAVRILEKAGYDGYLSIEFEGAEENIFALEAGLDYLKKIVK